MPYGLIPLIASVLLGVYHAAVSDAPALSKWIVSVLVAGALLIWWRLPVWALGASILQAAVSIYVLIYTRVSEPE
jgi:hypothetical protein